jgi:hypothetical protein
MTKHILITMAFMIGICSSSYGQFFTSFEASAGEAAAESFVMSDLGFSQPLLIAIATVNEDFDAEFGGIPVSIDAGIDIANGESEAWVYVYNENGTEEIATVGVVNVFGSFQATDVSEELGDQIPELEYAELINNWNDSPEICSLIRENIDYKGYMLSNPKSKSYFSGIYVTDVTTGGTELRSIWTVTFGENEEYICFVDANTGQTECDILSSVEVLDSIDDFVFYPNPTTDILNYDYKSDSEVLSITIMSLSGKKQLKYIPTDSKNINVSNLSTGTYILIVETNKSRTVKKLIIN